MAARSQLTTAGTRNGGYGVQVRPNTLYGVQSVRFFSAFVRSFSAFVRPNPGYGPEPCHPNPPKSGTRNHPNPPPLAPEITRTPLPVAPASTRTPEPGHQRSQEHMDKQSPHYSSEPKPDIPDSRTLDLEPKP